MTFYIVNGTRISRTKMKIGVMVREIGKQVDAPGIIILNLLDHLLQLDRINEYILFYKHPAFIDHYASYPNVRCVLVPAPNKFLWDQLAIPWKGRKEKIDILFHPKHSLPLFIGCKTLMHLRGSDYWIYPEHFERFDLLYQKLFLPLFCHKATHLILESEYVKDEFQRMLHIPNEKMTMIYLAPNDRFGVISDPRRKSMSQEKYRLPEEFCLTVTRIVQGRKYYAGKNLINIIKGFLQSEASRRLKFVIIGRQTKAFIEGLSFIPDEARENIMALDFVPQEDLPEIYNLAKFFLFPSRYESFGMPIVEAMACGCPTITSTTSACPEIAGGAALLVDPDSSAEIAGSIDLLNNGVSLREELRNKGLERVKRFTWRQAAEETLEVIKNLGKPV